MTENIWEKHSRKIRTNPKYREIDVQNATLEVIGRKISSYIDDDQITPLPQLINRLNVATGISSGLIENVIMKDDSRFLKTLDRTNNVWVAKNKLNL